MSSSHLSRLVGSGVFGVVESDLEGRLGDVNEVFLDLLGYDRAECLALTWNALTPPEHAAADVAAFEQLRQTGVAACWEKELIRKDGSRVPVMAGAALKDGSETDWVGFVLDLRAAREKWREGAPTKAEGGTVVWDRPAILSFLEQELARVSKDGHPMGVVLAAIEDLGPLRQTRGGDAVVILLLEVAERAKTCLRSYDGIGIHGPGEILLVLPECDRGGVLSVARRVQAAVAREPFVVGNAEISVSLSLGGATSEERYDCNAGDLVQDADTALYRARSKGGSRVELAR